MTRVLTRLRAFFVIGGVFSVFMVAEARGQSYPAPAEGDFVAKGYRFESGETMPEVRVHSLWNDELGRFLKDTERQ